MMTTKKAVCLLKLELFSFRGVEARVHPTWPSGLGSANQANLEMKALRGLLTAAPKIPYSTAQFSYLLLCWPGSAHVDKDSLP